MSKAKVSVRASGRGFEGLELRRMLSAATASVTWKGHTAEAVAGQYTASVKPGVDFAKIAAAAGFTDVRALGSADFGFWVFDTAMAPKAVARWASARSGSILAVQPDYVASVARVPNDTYYAGNKWDLNNTGQTIPSPTEVPNSQSGTRQVGQANADISAQEAWDITTGDPSVIIGSVDSGLDVNHPDLANNVWINPGEIAGDSIDNDGNGYVDDINGWNSVDNNASLTDGNGHGTATTGVIAASGNNNLGVTGVAWQAQVIMSKVFGDAGGSATSTIISGITYLLNLKRHGTNIAAINASLGGFSPEQVFSPVYSRVVEAARRLDIVFVASAGNDGINIDRTFAQPSRTSLSQSNAIAVAATNNLDKLSAFSSYGAASVQVAAPGEQIFTTWPTAATDNGTNVPGYTSIDGTSFSAPIVAGIVALARSVKPSATAAEIVSALKAGVDVVPDLAGKVSTGGRVNAYKTLRILQSTAVGTNTAVRGDWTGRYGATSAYVFGSSTGPLPFSTLTTGPTPTQIVPIVTKPRAPEDVRRPVLTAGAVARASSSFVGANVYDIPLDLGTTARRVSLYAVDYAARRPAAQTVTVTDTDSGVVLATTTMSGLAAGQYASFDLTGKVNIRVTGAGGAAVRLSGFYVDAAATASGQLAGVDTTTQGGVGQQVRLAGLLRPRRRGVAAVVGADHRSPGRAAGGGVGQDPRDVGAAAADQPQGPHRHAADGDRADQYRRQPVRRVRAPCDLLCGADRPYRPRPAV